ncbi:MAG: hypothetical protein A2Y91_02055 [Chloroflexi bacterium RBG_13_54_8]|nr:MAG: hypothetical protein A2Y91_02055 [Chloroflexi bacterium RBG_13_54_8]
MTKAQHGAQCPDCGADMGDPVDTTYSNMKTMRCSIGQHTGDIYSCEKCELRWLAEQGIPRPGDEE